MITRAIMTGMAALTLVSAGAAVAQTVEVVPQQRTIEVVPQQRTIEIVPQQRTIIRQYIVKERVPQVTVRERVDVGSVVPPDVELREVPADWGAGVRGYRYYYSGDRVYFVDPGSRRVVYDFDEAD